MGHNMETKVDVIEETKQLYEDELVVNDLIRHTSNYKTRVAYMKLLAIIRMLRRDLL